MTKVPKKQIIVVLGMHRSGTSAVTRSLRALHVELGDRLMPPLVGNNPTGFWEDIEINALNIEMLRTIEDDWHHLSPIRPQHIVTLRKAGFLGRAADLLETKLRDRSIFGFKDPRTAKLLPFWKLVFERFKFEVKYVLAIRHPLSVVKSLAKRDRFAPEKSYFLWLAHVLESLSGTNNCQRVLVDYDRLIENPDREIKRLASMLDLTVSAAELSQYKTEFLDSSMRHTLFELSDLAKDPSCPPLVQEVYPELLGGASDRISLDAKKFQKNLTAWEHEFARDHSVLELADKLELDKISLVQSITGLNQAIIERDGQVVGLSQTMAERENQIAGFNQAMVERDGQVAGLSQTMAERENQIAGLNLTIAERDSQVANLSQAVAERENQIAALNQAMVERDGQVAGLSQTMAERENQIARLNQTILDRDGQVASLNSMASEQQKQIAGLVQAMFEREERISKFTLELDAEQQARSQSEQDAARRENALLEKANDVLHSLEKLAREHAQQNHENAREMQRLRDQAEQEKAAHARDEKEREHALGQHYAEKERILLLQLDAERKTSRQLEQELRQLERLSQEEINGLRIEIEVQKHANQRSAQQHDYDISAMKIERNLALQARNTAGARAVAEQKENNQLRQELTELHRNLAQIKGSFTWRILTPLRKLGALGVPPTNSVPLGYDSLFARRISEQLISDQSRMAGDGLFVGQTFQSERSDGTLHVEETAMQVATKVETTDLPPAEAPNCESLMQYQGQQFVEATYVTLLKRLPDADGLNFYLGRMHDGVSKFQILREIFFSQECRDAGIELPGLREALTQADGLQ